jgi:hypothetical protein
MACKIILSFLILGSVLSTSWTLSTSGLFGRNGEKLYCKDPHGNYVDWWIAYKIPKQPEAPMDTGYAFAYTVGPIYYFLSPVFYFFAGLVGLTHTAWKLSDELITDPNSMFGKTLAPLHAHPKDFSYVMYNDDPAHDSGRYFFSLFCSKLFHAVFLSRGQG